jgi:hypothetical protein
MEIVAGIAALLTTGLFIDMVRSYL